MGVGFGWSRLTLPSMGGGSPQIFDSRGAARNRGRAGAKLPRPRLGPIQGPSNGLHRTERSIAGSHVWVSPSVGIGFDFGKWDSRDVATSTWDRPVGYHNPDRTHKPSRSRIEEALRRGPRSGDLGAGNPSIASRSESRHGCLYCSTVPPLRESRRRSEIVPGARGDAEWSDRAEAEGLALVLVFEVHAFELQSSTSAARRSSPWHHRTRLALRRAGYSEGGSPQLGSTRNDFRGMFERSAGRN